MLPPVVTSSYIINSSPDSSLFTRRILSRRRECRRDFNCHLQKANANSSQYFHLQPLPCKYCEFLASSLVHDLMILPDHSGQLFMGHTDVLLLEDVAMGKFHVLRRLRRSGEAVCHLPS